MNKRHKFVRSFRHAYEGLLYSLRTQTNMQLHFVTAAAILLLALVFEVSPLEFLFLFLAIVLVMMAELFNTAIEKTVDLAMPDHHPMAKIAKDVAAAAVLVTAAFAAVVGLVVFYDPLQQLFQTGWMNRELGMPRLIAWITLIAVTLSMVHASLPKEETRTKPSILATIAFTMASLIALLSGQALTAVLAMFLAAMICLVLYEKTQRSFLSLLWGGVLGAGATSAFYFILWIW